MSRTDRNVPKFDAMDDDEEAEESKRRLSDLIFLPFHPIFKMFVLFSVIVKSMLGPIKAVYSTVHCSDVMDQDIYLSFIKHFYWYFSDLIYFLDTFFHVVHRQVTEKAMRREHLPKSAFLLLIDVISLIPFYTLTTSENCPPVQLWPNILSFLEFIIIYRVVYYFSMLSTHSFWKLAIGFMLLVIICVNCVGCFYLLLTKHGLCARCDTGIYDWRQFVLYKLNETDERFTTYVYGTSFVLSFVLENIFDETKPSTILEYFVVSMFMISGYLLVVYIVIPKLFSESVLGLRRICTFHSRVTKLVHETRRRNPCQHAHVTVTKFYNLMWKKRKGITHIPEIISELPRSLRVDIRQDLVWPVFYHSPTLRKTSTPFKRWICEFIHLDYKLPGEKFFAGPHCHSTMYYLKSGIIELISADDGVTPLLSLSGGTILGDISFMVPPLKRNLSVRCITYCEVLKLSRYDILKAIQKYPVDRVNILRSVKERIKHARTLYTCKQHVRGLDRTEDEGIAWLKRRWWEISDAVANWKKKSKNDQIKCDLPPEEAVYHCAKYIGQLVLCCNLQLQKKSLFANVKFPWILTPESSFLRIWHMIVMFTVFLVLITYPPNMIRVEVFTWFKFIQYWTDFVYMADICISILTSTSKDNDSEEFTTVLFARCKRLTFVLDVFATVWIELMAVLLGRPDLYNICQLNRIIKIYILFTSEHVNEWHLKRDPIFNVLYKIILTNFCHVYISAYTAYVISKYVPNITKSFFFGENFKNDTFDKKMQVHEKYENLFIGVPLAYIFEDLFFEYIPTRLADNYFAVIATFISFSIYMVTKSHLISYLYVRDREKTNYQSFVTNLKKYYKHHLIHRDLLKRLDKYLVCQWKYYKGKDILYPTLLKFEPFDIFWKVHGEVAEKLIGESSAFLGAEPSLVKELAYASKFLIMPRNATLLLFGVQSRNVTWIVQGHIRCEYHNERGELIKKISGPGQMIAMSAVLQKMPSLRTYSSCTECELIYIKIEDFFNILKRYPHECSYFQNCIDEFAPAFQNMFEVYIKKHREYLKKLRVKVFHGVVDPKPASDLQEMFSIDSNEIFDPESDFMFYWMLFRTISVIVSICCASLQGGIGALIMQPLRVMGGLCDAIACVDVILKMIMPYYNEKGIIIYNTRMCTTNYLTRGFVMDVIGIVPWNTFCQIIMTKDIPDDQIMFLNVLSKFSHLYIVMGFFNHIANAPSANSIYILIIKWHVVTFLLMLGGSHYLMSRCIDFKFDNVGNLVHMSKLNACWLPMYQVLDEEPTVEQLHLVFAQSLNLAQSGLVRMNLGKFQINRTDLGVGIALVILGVVFWYITCYSLTLLVLSTRGDKLFQHSVSQLQKFLTAERVDKNLINNAVAHFTYWWMRTRGINVHHLMSERIGVVFRQDLSYFFFKKTFSALDTLLHGGELLKRQLSSIGLQIYFRPDEQIMREKDFLHCIYIVHRGKVVITKDGEKLAVLRKGAIFGPLNTSRPRPVRVSAKADGCADILQIPITQFQDIINDEVRSNISRNPQSNDDYMTIKRPVTDNGYNTIEYILRGRKTIQLPWMNQPIEVRKHSWYSRWLYVAWFIGPSLSAAVVLLLSLVPNNYKGEIYWFLLFWDAVYFAHFISEFYTMELIVVKDSPMKRRMGYRLLKNWSFYADLISLIIPLMSSNNNWDWIYQLTRLLRLRLLYDFHLHFCSSFKSRINPILMKLVIVFLSMHAMVCGWVYFACRDSKFPVPLLELPLQYHDLIDFDEWVHPENRSGGCPRMTMNFKLNDSESYRISFLVPKEWQYDYIVALTYIVLLHTHTAMDLVVGLNITQVYYKVVINFLIFVMDLWIISMAISAVYTKYQELYQYDYGVNNLCTYLSRSGLSPTLLDIVKEYTRQLWQRQRGNWLPELAHQAPTCLREDIFSALYMHHLMTPPIFKKLPDYFRRQLVARFQRVVLFPGKSIIEEGDIYACAFFIHEGEVERWYTEPSGERKMMALLTTNNYFGVVPSFCSTPFLFSYCTRTVVDLVYLKFSSWKDLLEAYPDIKTDLTASAEKLRKEQTKGTFKQGNF